MTEPKVFIVDDDEIAVEITESFVRHFVPGAEVQRYMNGRDALEALKRDCPRIVFLDYMMPVMDGMEFLRQLRGLSDLTSAQQPFVAVVSAFVDRQRVNLFYEAGADAVLSKPVIISEIGNLFTRIGHT